MTFFLISQCRFSDLSKSTAVFILGKKNEKNQFFKINFFLVSQCRFSNLRCGVGDERFLQPKPVTDPIVLSKIFFKSTAVFYTCKKIKVRKQPYHTKQPYFSLCTAVFYTCKKNHFFQNSRTKQPYFSLCLHVRLFQHLEKIKKINFFKINFFKYLNTLHSTLYTLHLAECGRVKSTAVFSHLKKIEPKLSKLWFETNQ